ncbi:MAG TPA: ABC transporter permease subunit [Chloroflexota bacterium]|nr:ABC transporter permease subunit [Chloroflexota bacterium]
MIRNVAAVAEREIRSYFVSPVAWVVTAVMIAMWGFLFGIIIPQSRQADLRPVLNNFSVTFLLAGPLLTMRLIAEEARTGTLELLLTQPIRDVELVLGKYLGSVVFLLFMLAMTLYFPLLLNMFGNPDRGPMVGGYLGVMLQGMAFLAIGLMASALTQNQIIAAAVTFVTLLLLWLSDSLSRQFTGIPGQVAQYVSITKRFEDMPRGVVDTKDIVFFVTVIIACLFITTQIISARRWR